MGEFNFQKLFELAADETEYRLLGSEHVSVERFGD